MAIGILGEQRCFVFQEKDVKMPSDLYGFTTIHYDSQYINDNPRTAIGPAVSKFEQSIAGFREERVYASWESYWENVKKLHQQLSLSPSQGGFRYDLLIGISRGGCAVADLLCRQDGGRLPIMCMMPSYGNSKQQAVCFDNAFDAAQFALIETLEYQNILIVDDISRTGGTLCNLKTALEQRFPDRNVKCAALYVGAHCKNKLDFCVEETQLDLMLSMPYSR